MFPKFDHVIPRRRLLFAAGLVGGAGILGTTFGIPAASGKDRAPAHTGLMDDPRFNDPREELQTYVKIDGDLSGAPFGGWYDGVVYTIDRHRATIPLFGIEGFGIGWTKSTPDGKFRKAWKEVGFYKDLRTGRVIDRWHNPFNGRDCEVLQIQNRSVNVTESALFPVFVPLDNAASAHPIDQGEHPVLARWFVNGEMISVMLEARLEMPNPLNPREWPLASSGRRISITETFLEITKRSEVLDRRLTCMNVVGHWTRICPWLPWMLMGRAPGQILYQAATKKIRGVGDLPSHLRDYTAAHFPDFLHVPTEADFKIPIESTWDVYKRTHRPQ